MAANELSPLQEIERRVQARARRPRPRHGRATTAGPGCGPSSTTRWRPGPRDFKRGLRAFDLADPELVAEPGLPQPGRLRPARAPPGRRRRLGDHDQRSRPDLREAPPGAERLPRRGLQRRRPRRPHAHQDPRRRVRPPPQARPGRGPAGRPARHRRPPPHRPRRRRPRRPHPGQHPEVHRRRRSATCDELVERDMLDTRVAEFLRACVRARLSIGLLGRAGLGQDHAALVLRGRARPHACGS